MSHTRHDDNQAGNGPRRTDPPSLTVPRRISCLSVHASPDTVGGNSSSGLIHRREPNLEENSSGADPSPTPAPTGRLREWNGGVPGHGEFVMLKTQPTIRQGTFPGHWHRLQPYRSTQRCGVSEHVTLGHVEG
jgi:hypothetical protein